MSLRIPAIENSNMTERIALVTDKLSEEFPDCRVLSWQDDALEKSQIAFFKVVRESDGAYVTRALSTTSLVRAREVLGVIRMMADGIRKELGQMSKQRPADLAAEQRDEIRRWLIEIAIDALPVHNDYATVAHLHRALAGVMRNYQKFKAKQAALQAEAIQHMIDEAKKEDAGGRT